MTEIDFSRLWVATKHVKGAWNAEPFVQFMKRNNQDLLAHRAPDRTLLHVCGSLEEARKYNRDMAHRIERLELSEEPRASAGEAREGNRTDVVGTDITDLTEVKKNDI